MMKEKNQSEPIMVSVQVLVFNHEPYLRDCLNGIVKQRTNFRFEAIVHDDCSTDNSVKIIQEFAAKYPSIVKPILEDENQFSKGGNKLTKIMFNACKGKYIAMCEGDDYWTDYTKLQRQFEFLEENKEYVAATENSIILYTESGLQDLFSTNKEKDININELIIKRQFPTASVFVRNNIFGDDYYSLKFHNDTTCWCYIATKGKIKYFPIISSVYRRGPGVTEKIEPYEWAQICEQWYIEIEHSFHKYLKDKKIINDIIVNQFIGSGYVCLEKKTGNFLKCIKAASKYNIVKALTKGVKTLIRFLIIQLKLDIYNLIRREKG